MKKREAETIKTPAVLMRELSKMIHSPDCSHEFKIIYVALLMLFEKIEYLERLISGGEVR